jgi:transposase
MNSAYFLINTLTPLEEAIFPQGRAPHQKRLVIHLDNYSVHTSQASAEWLEEQGMRRMPQPPYSLDLTPSDFYLFRTVKEKLERTRVTDEDQFFESLQVILKGIDQEELNRIFQTWV